MCEQTTSSHWVDLTNPHSGHKTSVNLDVVAALVETGASTHVYFGGNVIQVRETIEEIWGT